MRALGNDSSSVTTFSSAASPRTRSPRHADGRLVGRQAELERLDAMIAGLRADGPRVVEVVGEPGIGKTRLLAELRARAERAGLLVLAGRAAELERGTPFGVVIEALDDHLAVVDPRRLERVGADSLEPLGMVFPALAHHAGGAEVEPHRLHRALWALLTEITPPRGLVLVLDDLHWADEASIELISHLVHDQPPVPILLVLACRPRQRSARLSAALATPVGETSIERLEVGPLSVREADELLGERMSRWRRRALYQDSGGNPFYLGALAWSHSRPRESHGSVSIPVPPMAQAFLLSEFHALSETGRLVAHAAAVAGVAGEPFSLEFVAAIAELGPGETLAALDELLAADLIRPAASPGRLCFRHHFVRGVVYEAAGAGWRLAAHARAAAVLAADGASAVARAPHVACAAGIGDEQAIMVLRDAARVMRSQAPAMVAQWLRAALRLLPQDGDRGEGTRRLELLSELAVALMSAGHAGESRDTFHEVLRLFPSGCAERRTWAVMGCAIADQLLGRHAEARALLCSELAALPGAGTRESIALKLVLATSGLSDPQEDLGASLAWGEEALASASRSQDTALHAAALAAMAYVSVSAGGIRRAVQCVREAAPLFDALPDGKLAGAQGLQTLVWLGWSELQLERYDDAIRHLRRGLDLARQSGHLFVVPALLHPLGYAYRRLGRLEDAACALDDAVGAALLIESDTLRGPPLALRSYVAVLAEDYRLAERAGQEAQEAAEEAGQGNDRAAALARSAVAWARLATTGAVGYVEEIVDAWGGAGLPALDALERPEVYEALVRAELARGCADAADRWAERAEATVATVELSIPTGFALLARGYTLLIGDPAGSAERALAAVEAFHQVGSRFEAGRAHLLAGTALAAAGERSRALGELRRAEALFQAPGARGLREQVLREQRQLGRSRAHDTQEPIGLPALSVRELEIAELVAEGHTNRQIARALSLSDKTIETHLSRTFSKLGVRSRAAVATAVTQARGAGAGRPRAAGGPALTLSAR